MKMKILASGSKGNSSYYETNKIRFLIDIGISYKRVKNILEKDGFDISKIDALFITHEHSDHVSGIYTFLKRTVATIYMTKGTFDSLSSKKRGLEIKDAYNNGRIYILNKDVEKDIYKSVNLYDVQIKPQQSFHDAAEPCNYVMINNDIKICLITDTGYIHRKQLDDFKGANCYVLETNHDPEILMSSDRPYPLKQRILSTTGHLSNEDSMYLLTKLITEKTSLVYYAHISDECNLFELVDETRKQVFSNLNVSSEKIKFVFTGQFSCEVVTL